MKKNSGFTLIELLVVIAVIGILASIVLAALGSSRDKGNDSKIQLQLESIRNAAEIYYTSHGNSYSVGNGTDSCHTTKDSKGNFIPTPNTMFNDATSGLRALSTTSNYPAGTDLFCGSSSDGTKWSVSASLSKGNHRYWCVDSSGSSMETGQPYINGVACGS
jgi:general secretion pathway protein G